MNLSDVIKEQMEELDKEFLGCDEHGSYCSAHQFKSLVRGRLPTKLRSFLATSMQKAAEAACGEVEGRLRQARKEVYEVVRKAVKANEKEHGIVCALPEERQDGFDDGYAHGINLCRIAIDQTAKKLGLRDV